MFSYVFSFLVNFHLDLELSLHPAIDITETILYLIVVVFAVVVFGFLFFI